MSIEMTSCQKMYPEQVARNCCKQARDALSWEMRPLFTLSKTAVLLNQHDSKHAINLQTDLNQCDSKHAMNEETV